MSLFESIDIYAEENLHLDDQAAVDESTAETSAATLDKLRNKLSGGSKILEIQHAYLEARFLRVTFIEAMLQQKHGIKKNSEFWRTERARAIQVDTIIAQLQEQMRNLLSEQNGEVVKLAWNAIGTQSEADGTDWIQASLSLISMVQGTH